MGASMNCCAQTSNKSLVIVKPKDKDKINPNENTDVYTINQIMNGKRLKQLLDITNQYNINHKYRNYFHLIPDQFQGTNLRKANQYVSLINDEQIEEVKQQFWETRIEGNKKVWAKIQEAILAETNEKCRKILKEKGLMIVSDNIQLIIDRKGIRYELPIFVLYPPSEYNIKDHLQQIFQQKILKLNLRSQLTIQNLQLDIDNVSFIKDVKDMFYKEQQLNTEKKIKFFYNGKELKDEFRIGNYKIKSNSSISVFIF